VQKYLRISEIASNWGIDPSTVPRVMGRFGFSGSKTGPSPQCARLYDEEDVQQVEALMRKYKRKRKKAK
jgi:hypothetical protein